MPTVKVYSVHEYNNLRPSENSLVIHVNTFDKARDYVENYLHNDEYHWIEGVGGYHVCVTKRYSYQLRPWTLEIPAEALGDNHG